MKNNAIKNIIDQLNKSYDEIEKEFANKPVIRYCVAYNSLDTSDILYYFTETGKIMKWEDFSNYQDENENYNFCKMQDMPDELPINKPLTSADFEYAKF